MSLERRWQTHEAFLQDVERVPPGIRSLVADWLHTEARRRVLNETADMFIEGTPTEERLQYHQSFLQHVGRVSPELLAENALVIHTEERRRGMREYEPTEPEATPKEELG